MDLTKTKKDKQPVEILIDLIEWHGIGKCRQAYEKWLKDYDPIYYRTRTKQQTNLSERHLALEIADVIGVDREYYVNDAPGIETELVEFLEKWT